MLGSASTALLLGMLVALPLAPAGAQNAAMPRDTMPRDTMPRDTAMLVLRGALVTIGSPADDDARLRQLDGAATAGFLLRAPSSLTPRIGADGKVLRAFLLPPRLRATYNSDLPYSLNDEALWAGRGTSLEVLLGGGVQMGRVRLILAPAFVHSQNQDYALADPTISPPVPASRNPFSSPWHAGSQSVDLPIRFGSAPLTRVTAGQSSLIVSAGPVELGAATENEWWGPGIRNALLLSNNAEGFPHLLVRTAHPVSSPLGSFEARWLAGGLTESAFFDFDPGNDLRSISLLGVTLAPRGAPGLTIGAARSVYDRASNWATALTSFPQAFAHVGQPDAVPLSDSTSVGGRDALTSLFARYVMPASGAEVYAEWGRAESPRSLRDFLEQPNHSQGYTLGVQWLGGALARTGGRLRVQGEATYVEQSTTYRFRPIGSWYTSHAVPQGYTQRGQPLGAAIGPGSSSQFLALDQVATGWQVGAYLTRVRWLEDAETQKRYPLAGIGRCSHDVSTLPGVRGRIATPFGTFSADYSSGWRLNVFFDQATSCESGRGARNKSLTVGFTPR
jgi:hypothetical protein